MYTISPQPFIFLLHLLPPTHTACDRERDREVGSVKLELVFYFSLLSLHWCRGPVCVPIFDARPISPFVVLWWSPQVLSARGVECGTMCKLLTRRAELIMVSCVSPAILL